MYSETIEEEKKWISHLDSALKILRENPRETKTSETSKDIPNGHLRSEPEKSGGSDSSSGSPRDLLIYARNEIPFLQNESSKLTEFFHLWYRNLPERNELPASTEIRYDLSVSFDLQKIIWKISSAQNFLVQKLVDFFSEVEAPDTEIDHLNDVGSSIRPSVIGWWIGMSAKGAMDGGWFFPVFPEISIDLAVPAADPCSYADKISEFKLRNSEYVKLVEIARDLGIPPRQTEFKFSMEFSNSERCLESILDACDFFGFPRVPAPTFPLIMISPKVYFSVTVCSEGFVKIGIWISGPERLNEEIWKICDEISSYSERDFELLDKFRTFGDSPDFMEIQYLMKGFGYGVFKEGFDVIFHYHVGTEAANFGRI